MAFFEARGVTKSYTVGTTRLTVLRDLDLVVEAGEMVAVVGASGVGKSTLLHVLGGLDAVDAGSIAIAGHQSDDAGGRGPGGVSQPAGRLRVPVPPSPAGVQRGRERGDADADCAAARRRTRVRAPMNCFGASGSASG